MSRSEDTNHTLVFVDMLGFSFLTEKFPTRLIDSGENHGQRSGFRCPITVQ
jgi:hypothetical protein